MENMENIHLLDLPEDVIGEIHTHLCYVDQVSFKISICHKIKLNFKSIIKRKLEHHVEDPEDFINALTQNNCYISGSFILACLYDNMDYSDIDIYEYVDGNYNCNNFGPYENVSPMQRYYYEHDYECTTDSIFTDIIYIIRGFSSKKMCIKYNNNVQIQHIVIRSNIKHFISESFDIDLCKNIFNGNLYVYNWDNLIGRSSSIKPTWILTSGYSLRLTSKNTTNVKELNEAHEKRIDKYVNRGYTVFRHPKYKEICNLFEKHMIKYDLTHKNDGLNAWKLFVENDMYAEYLKLVSFTEHIDSYIPNYKTKNTGYLKIINSIKLTTDSPDIIYINASQRDIVVILPTIDLITEEINGKKFTLKRIDNSDYEVTVKAENSSNIETYKIVKLESIDKCENLTKYWDKA